MKQDRIGTILAITLGVLIGLWAVTGCTNGTPTTQQISQYQTVHDDAQAILLATESTVAVLEGLQVIPPQDVVLATAAQNAAQQALDTWQANIGQPFSVNLSAQYQAALKDLVNIIAVAHKNPVTAAKLRIALKR